MRIKTLLSFLFMVASMVMVGQEILPFPPTPSASTAGVTIQNSYHQKREIPKRLPDDAPNILIILIDDAGPATPTTYGGEIKTPNLSRIADEGISFNRFHTTAMCSPTRASLLTGRNHTNVGNGVITALANDWDGYSGIIPKSSATVAEVLKHYGYNTSAFGKWHNTPEEQTTPMGPFDLWPTGYGFEYFYGFIAGEASQYEPHLIRNTTIVNPEELHGKDGKEYHLTEDLTEEAIKWLQMQKSLAPDKPFFMYWAPGAVHGPHHVNKEWADKYKGKFDDGWDEYRKRAFKRQKELGWIPEDAELTERPETMASWESIPEDEKDFQRRLMEVYAGFGEHTDYNIGKIFDELERQGEMDNTIIFYIWGDNGSSAEGMNGSISEQLAQNGIKTEISQHIDALEELGGLDALGSDKTDNMYHSSWAWAGSTPYKSTKLVAAHFGGTRNPMAVSWPKSIPADKKPRSQFHHVNDIVPTIYDVLDIQEPHVVNGIEQDPIDGVSMAYTFEDAEADGEKKVQFFDIMGSRGIYYDEWYACAFGLRTPWMQGLPAGAKSWSPNTDKWELYNLKEDWSQANDLAEEMPEKLQEMKNLFLVEAAKNDDLPIGGAFWSSYMMHPEDAPSSGYTSWEFNGPTYFITEKAAPKLGIKSNKVEMQIETNETANGVLYSLGGFNGGLCLYVKDGVLNYEYNLFEVERTTLRAKKKLPKGKATIEVISKWEGRIGTAMDVVINVNGKEFMTGTVPQTITLQFSPNDCLNIGADYASPVSLGYFDLAPFEFNGTIKTTKIEYTK